MIKEFLKKQLFFPRTWANAVARWISGVNSPDGSIIVKNTLNPGQDGSLELKVNLDRIVSEVAKRYNLEGQLDRNNVRDIVWDMVDGATVMIDGRRISINKEWLDRYIQEHLPESTVLQERQIDSSTRGKNYDISDAVLLSMKSPAELTINTGTENTNDRIARIGSSERAAREDHKHLLPVATVNPNADGTPTPGTSNRVARGDHVHPLNIGTTATTYAAGNHTHDGMLTTSSVDFINLKTKADNTKDKADSAFNLANDAKDIATEAASDAADAKATANAASSSAATAQSTANSAQSTANSAQSTATAAQSTANTANSNASAAQTAAKSAQTTANSAQSTANSAKTTATAAQTAAKSAQTTANSAQSTANSANTTATAAQTAAQSAQSTADSALSKAEQALAALGGGSGGGGGGGGTPVDLSALQTQVQTNTSNIQELQGDVQNAQTSIETLEDNVETLQTDMEAVKTDTEEFESKIEEFEEDEEELILSNNRNVSMLARFALDFYDSAPTPDDTGETPADGGNAKIPTDLIETDVDNLKADADNDQGKGAIGTSEKLCYSDHVHPLSYPVAPASPTDLGGGVYTGMANHGTTAGGSGKDAAGMTFLVACSFGDGGAAGKLWFRPITVSKDGRIVSVGSATESVKICTDF